MRLSHPGGEGRQLGRKGAEHVNNPTPLTYLPGFSKLIGRELWMKRDDCNGDVLTAGNKQRKIHRLLADAQSKGADVVLTSGGPQSNHARALAAMAIQAGIKPLLVLGGTEPAVASGNYLLNRLMGVEMIFTGAATQAAMGEALLAAERNLLQEGRHPYVIPVGGSNALGALAYAEAYAEFKEQSKSAAFDWIFVSAGSGGTMGGLVAGQVLQGDRTRIVGISPWLREAEIGSKVAQCANEALALLKSERTVDSGQILISDAYIGEGYGIPTPAGMEALSLLAKTEAILLDPVYTAKAMAGCLDYIRRGIVQPADRILFWHTGGAPSVFVHNLF